MKMLLFVSVLAVLTCLGVVVAAVLASKRGQGEDEKKKSGERGNF